MPFYLHDLVTKAAEKWPENIAIVEAGESASSITYKQLEEKVRNLSGQLLQKGLEKDQRIGILSENSIEFAGLYFAISRAGGVVVPLNHALALPDIIRLANDCGLSALYASKELKKKFKGITDKINSLKFIIEDIPCAGEEKKTPLISEKGPVSIIYTSGTTGKPLGVTLSHRNILSNSKAIAEYTGITSSDKICCVLPFYYIYGLSLLFSHFLAGGTVIIDNRFMYPNTILETIDKYKATGFAGVPSHYAIMLYISDIKGRKFPSLKYFMQAGDKMPEHITAELLNIFPKKKLYIMYGQTEASPRLTYLSPDSAKKKPNSIGKAIPGVKIKVVNDSGTECEQGKEGEIVARGDNIMLGYWNNDKETAKIIKDGWLHTGDIAFKDKEGDLFITGRKKDFIKIGGNRVNPCEIERLVLENERIAEAAALGIPDSILGEKIKLFVALIPGKKLDKKEIMARCKEQLPSYSIPSDIAVLKSIPKNSYGKIDKKTLGLK